MKGSLLFFVLTLVAICANSQSPNLPKQLDSLISSWAKPGFPGGVIAVMQNDTLLIKQAYGLEDLKERTPLEIYHAFDLASVAKQFTGMCIALLEEQGKLSATDDIKKYYPHFQYEDTITIQHLLSHTSGIREGYVLAMLSGKTNLLGKLRKKYDEKKLIFELLATQKELNFEPGSEMAYTNVNFIILGDIVEKVSGISLRQFADSAIFQPLGMRHTVFRDSPDMEIASLATGYSTRGKGRWKKGELIGGIVGDHNLISTVDDLLLWVQNFDENRLGGNGDHLIARITRPDTLNDSSPLYYNYGLEVADYEGHKQVAHGGDNGLHTSYVSWFPEENLSIIHLSNHADYRFTVDGVYVLASLLLGVKEEKHRHTNELQKIEIREEELKQWEGIYSFIAPNGLGEVRKVTVKEARLYSSFHPKNLGKELIPVGPGHFVLELPSEPPVEVVFSMDSLTGAAKLTEKRDGWSKSFRAFPAEAENMVALKNYSGTYTSPELGTRMKVKAKKNKLVMVHKTILRLEMISLQQDTFYMADAPAVVVFNRKGSEVSGMTVNAWDFRNFQLEKR